MGKATSKFNRVSTDDTQYNGVTSSNAFFDENYDITTLILGYIHDIEHISKVYSPPDIIELIIIFTNIHYKQSELSINIGHQLDLCDVGYTGTVVSWLNATIIAQKECLETVPEKYQKYITEGYANKNFKDNEIQKRFGLLLHFDGFPLEWDDYYRWIFIENKSMINDIICSCIGECKHTKVHRIAPYNTQTKGGILDNDYPIYGTPNIKNIIGLTNYDNTSYINTLIQCLYNGPKQIYEYIKNNYNNNNILCNTFTLFAFMKSNEYKVVGTNKLCHTIKNECNFQLECYGINQMDKFLIWFLEQLFVVYNKKDESNDIFLAKLLVKKKCEMCNEIKYDKIMQLPYISLPITFRLDNITKEFYVYDLNVNNYTLFEYVFNVNKCMVLKDIKNAICKLREIDNESMVYYICYNTDNKTFEMADINETKSVEDAIINGFVIINNDIIENIEEKYELKEENNIYSNFEIIPVLMENKYEFSFPICLKKINGQITNKMIYNKVYKVLNEMVKFDVELSTDEWNDKIPFTLQSNSKMIEYNNDVIENDKNINDKMKIVTVWSVTSLINPIIRNPINKSECKYKIELNFDSEYIVEKLEERKYDNEIDIYDCFDELIYNNITFENESELCVKHENDPRILKQLNVLSLPNVLFINLQRIDIDTTKDNKFKQKISFPINDEELDFKKYSFVNDKSCKYRLFGAICFDGMCGEFYVYVFNKELNKWYRIKDSKWRESNENEITRQDYICVLCYSKIE